MIGFCEKFSISQPSTEITSLSRSGESELIQNVRTRSAAFVTRADCSLCVIAIQPSLTHSKTFHRHVGWRHPPAVAVYGRLDARGAVFAAFARQPRGLRFGLSLLR